MINVSIKTKFKSLQPVDLFELPDFCVLTGKNGSGKSHLFEAMANRKTTVITIDEKPVNVVQYIPFNGLNPNVGADCNYRNLLDEQKDLWNNIKDYLESHRGVTPTEQNFQREIVQNYGVFLPQAKELYKRVNGDLQAITEELVNEYFAIRPQNEHSFFSSQFASIFKLYANRLEKNAYNAFRNKEHDLSLPVLTKEDFEKKYGPKPWVLINEMMAGAGLSYRVNNPEGQERDDDFHLQLSDVDRNIEVQVKDLSTGERVLMSLALAIYNTNEDSMRPDILLLDEPDAALHPEFSKVLLKSINESIVQKAGVKVVISTHSPTTVALSEEFWLYQMEYGQYPHKVTKKHALNILLKDLEPLRVSVENRRQIFVESRNDVGYYENIYPLLPKKGVIVPQFLPASTKNGSNCQDVIEMVTALREKGNDLVYGIIDFDNHNSDEDNIFVLGEGKRYAIDNYVLDPLYVALLLIREKKDTFEDVEQNIKFTSLHNAPDELLQGIIYSVCSKIGFVATDEVNYGVLCGKTFNVKKEYFTIQGHELEEKIMNRWPQLNSVKRGRKEENVFKDYMIENVISEYPEFLSVDFVKILGKLK